jgi:hypothetical protein
MVHDEIIDWLITQHRLDLVKKEIGVADINGVYQRRFLIGDQVRIVGDTVWQRPQVLEKMFGAIIHTHVKNIFRDFEWFVHLFFFSDWV